MYKKPTAPTKFMPSSSFMEQVRQVRERKANQKTFEGDTGGGFFGRIASLAQAATGGIAGATQQGGIAGATQQGGMAGVGGGIQPGLEGLGSAVTGGSQADQAAAGLGGSTPMAGGEAGGSNPFGGQKFQITPVQMTYETPAPGNSKGNSKPLFNDSTTNAAVKMMGSVEQRQMSIHDQAGYIQAPTYFKDQTEGYKK